MGIEGVRLSYPLINFDARGNSFEVPTEFLPDNLQIKRVYHSQSEKNVLRGMHLARLRVKQNKIILCVAGKVRDIVVDLRKNSPTFLKSETFELDSSTSACLFIPPGVAHGYLSLENVSTLMYFISDIYVPDSELTFSAFDPGLKLKWMRTKKKVKMSSRDYQAPNLDEEFFKELNK